jgi:NAD-dependent SIR2 family protein deacetylase
MTDRSDFIAPKINAKKLDLTKWDSRDAPRTVVLLGAGASADAGLPTAQQLHTALSTRLPHLYVNIAGLLFPDEPVDVERLFRVLEFLHKIELDARSTQSILPTSERPEQLDIARLVGTWLPEIEEHLNTQRGAVGASPIGHLIDQLWIELCDLLWLDTPVGHDVGYLSYLLRAMAGGTIVTLNYDNCLERANQIGVSQRVNSGPYPGSYLPPPGPDELQPIRLIKLHGSLGWQYDEKYFGGVNSLTEDSLPGRVSVWRNKMFPVEPPAVIFGAGNKLRPDGPFLDMFMEFKQALKNAERLIVIGYSRGDVHVNTLLRDWLSDHDRPRLIRFNIYEGDDDAVDETEVARVFASDLKGDNHFAQIQVVYGRAAEEMDRLMAPDSGLVH